MIRKIVLENFMSHKRTVIEPSEGLTVLTGPNNCGKSAVVVALQALCENERSSKSFIRHREKEAKVSIETSEGHRIEWCRGQSASYSIDGRPVNRLKGGTPDDLHAKLRLPMVEVPGGEPVDIHFSEQKDPIFLVNDKGGGRAARFFSAASDAALLLKMQQLHKDQVRERRGEERLLVNQIDEAKRQMDAFEGFTDLEGKCAEGMKLYEKLTAQLLAARQRYGLRESIQELTAQATSQRALGASLQPLTPPPALADERGLSGLCAQIAHRTADADCLEVLGRACAPLDTPPALDDSASLGYLLAEITRKYVHAEKLAAKIDLAQRLTAMPQLEDPAILCGIIEKIAGYSTAAALYQGQKEALDREQEALMKQIRQYVAENPTCPVCGGPMDPAKVIANV